MTQERSALVQRALKLEYVTIAWNVIEAAVSIGAGIAAGSIALVGFGLDSCIEVAAAVAVLHRFLAKDDAHQLAAERRALRIVGGTFFLLAIYVSIESIHKLWTRDIARPSPVGMGITTLSALCMPFLARAKQRAAADLHSRALLADSRETLFCGVLSVVVLGGLAVNAWLGWWWADPVAGLIVVYFLVKEAREAWQGRGCGCGAD